MNPEANLVSFVVRFVGEDSPTAADGLSPAEPRLTRDWHGVIRHVQSNTERHFIHWSEAMAFMAQYVDLRDQSLSPLSDDRPA